MTFSNHRLSLALLLSAGMMCGLTVPVHAATVEVSQESAPGAGDFDLNILGTIGAYSFAGTVEDFYVDVPGGSSYGGDARGGPEDVSNRTQIFFLNSDQGLSMILLHDAKAEDEAPSGARTQVRLTGGAGGPVAYQVLDDPVGSASGDTYSTSDAGGARIFTANQNWSQCCTDGYAIGDLGPDFEIFASFLGGITGLSSFAAVGSDGASIALALQSERAVRLRSVAAVPLPATAWFLLASLGLLAGLRRRTA